MKEDVIYEIKDILVGWCRPMTDRERLETIAILLEVPENEWVWRK